MEVSIFDRFISKEPEEQKPFSPSPHRKLLSALDTAGKEARSRYPEDNEILDAFVGALKEAYKARYKKTDSPQPAQARFCLSEDRMRAYACLLPPENGGEGVALEELLEEMRYEGISSGVLQEAVQQELEQGYLRIFLAAQGTPPQPGEEGAVTELFQRSGAVCLEVQEEGPVDFSPDAQLQPIRKGAVICQIQPPKPGTDGMDVTGQRLPSPQVADIEIPQGKNTDVSKGGQALVASVDGILYLENDRFCIHEQKIIDGDLCQAQEPLQILGNLYIGGSVDGGAVVEASGDVVINGTVKQARITSMGGTIRVQQGIYGTSGGTFLTAAHQVQSPVMEQAEVDAGTDVVAEMISNCTIRCGGTVSVRTGRGMIAGSQIQAEHSVLCLRVGNLAGERSRFSVGYPLHIPESWDRIRTELNEVRATIEKLWKVIADLRRKGSRLSDGERSVLETLVEQRDLYLERREVLTAELKVVNAALDQKSKGRIQCEKLHPALEVQIGRLTEEITTMEENCNIRAVENRIFLK